MNPFQSKYPLSSKKFWKKFLPTIIPTLIISAMGGGFVGGFLPVILEWKGFGVSEIVGTVIVVAVLLFVVILFFYAWYFGAYIKSYFYQGEENFITIKKGVFAPREIHIQYQKIQDVYVDQDILDRIMGLYDVHIASATMASGMEAHIDGVEKDVAEGLKNFFLTRIHQTSNPGAMNAGVPGMVGADTVNVSVPASTAQFSEEISDATYPIQGSWMTKSIVGSVFTALILGFCISGYMVLRTSDSTSGGVAFFPIFIAISLVYFFFHVIGLFIWKGNYHFALTPEYVQYSTGILSKSEQHLPYRSIQDVNVNQSIFDRMFGLANVVIENAAQIQVGKRSMNAKVTITGLTPAQATHIVEVLKPVILARNSAQMGL